MILLVNYDIYLKGRDVSNLENAIKESGAWWHHLSNIWIVDTNDTPDQLYTRLAPHLYKADRILVVKIEAQHQGWLVPEAWQWLNERKY